MCLYVSLCYKNEVLLSLLCTFVCLCFFIYFYQTRTSHGVRHVEIFVIKKNLLRDRTCSRSFVQILNVLKIQGIFLFRARVFLLFP